MYVTESLSLFSSMYKSYDVSNVHVKSLYHRYVYKVVNRHSTNINDSMLLKF